VGTAWAQTSDGGGPPPVYNIGFLLLLVGIFSTFLGGALPWVAGGLFMAPLFFTLAFSPWLLLGSWQSVYTSTVWTLTYREIKALPAIAAPAEPVPAGD